MRLRPPSQRARGVAGSVAGPDGAGPRPPVRPALAVIDSALGHEAGPLLAARVADWPGALDVHAGGRWRTRIERPAGLGHLVGELALGPVGYWDEAGRLEIEMPSVSLSSRPRSDVLNGANRLAVQQANGDWEILGFAEAELVGLNRYRLRGLLRGLAGSAVTEVAPGARVVWVSDALVPLALDAHELGVPLDVQAVAAGWPVTDGSAVSVSHTHQQRALRPLPVVHVRAAWQGAHWQVRWVRQTRTGGDDWTAPEVDLGEAREAYRVRLLDGEMTVFESEVTTPELTLTEAELAGAFGALPEAVTLEIAQLSARLGAGRSVRRVLTL